MAQKLVAECPLEVFDSLIAGLQVQTFVLYAMVACSSMHKDCAYVTAFAASSPIVRHGSVRGWSQLLHGRCSRLDLFPEQEAASKAEQPQVAFRWPVQLVNLFQPVLQLVRRAIQERRLSSLLWQCSHELRTGRLAGRWHVRRVLRLAASGDRVA